MKPDTTWGAVVGEVTAHAREVRQSTWVQALDQAHGSITRAAKAIGISRVHGARLTKAYGLTDYARELRRASGLPLVGRPRKARVTRSPKQL